MASVEQIATLETPDGPIRINYIDTIPSTPSKGTILLIHGFPNTSYQFRHVTPLFKESGYRTIAPDYRGAGRSSKPATGFTPSA
jgi:pimeloyl-ACP methyl ester carboxylesterase